MNGKSGYPNKYHQRGNAAILSFLSVSLSLIAVLTAFSLTCFADERVLTIFQTSDIHSHFDNLASEHRLGGAARLKSKVDQLRRDFPNSLLLDSGDWSEGTLFFTLNSGFASQQVMSSLGYDAITLGNHDWLIGPSELARTFAESGMKIPVLSANLNFQAAPLNTPLKQFIRPYMVKVINGVRVGVFGLSTFQFIYDSFFAPIKIQEPFTVAQLNANYLRDVEKCDVVIALSHMGLSFDEVLAHTVSGIDVIAGGHSHILLMQPENVNGVIINHVGKWGEYIGQLQIGIPEAGRPYLKSSLLHAINETIPEDPGVAAMVKGYKSQIDKDFAESMFETPVFTSTVHDHLMDGGQDEPVGNWAIDAVREAAGADLAFDHIRYVQQNVLPGPVTAADIFNMWPHLYDSHHKKAWTIHTFELSGAAIQLILETCFRVAGGLKMSNMRLSIDYAAPVLQISSVTVGDQPLSQFQMYKVAATEGLIEAFKFVDKTVGTTLGAAAFHDTGLEVWRVIRQKLKTIGSVTPENAFWQGRVRSIQPDLYLPYEQLLTWKPSAEGMAIAGRFQILNIGMQGAHVGPVNVEIYKSADGGLTKSWVKKTKVQATARYLNPAQGAELRFDAQPPALGPGEHLYFRAAAPPSAGELHLANNVIEALLY